ncbi:protein kinase domain-containing protein [Piscinibacter gummiphilus]|uniref:AAA family ATPase n=1 Tax=Piscinibacter gummiphilus TaxID=946333 RepID=A0ABZ0D2V5_9BURK|nr:AAA family ATPase [Piscinibacter gummiphilus]WOB09836.1 AAA family ATPase [Piscinibacter gummiphilus]
MTHSDPVLYSNDHARVTRRTIDGHAVVVKQAIGTQAIKRLAHEIGMLKRLAHVAGVAKIAPVSAEAHTLVLEDKGGVSLAEHLREHPLAVPQVLAYAVGVVRTLAEVHKAGVIHRDIGPANLLIHPQTHQPTLIDFNIAAGVGDEQEADDAQGGIAGTLSYMSPEQTGRTANRPDQRSDLYSLGITLYELLAGRKPFESSDLLELVHAHLVVVPEAPAVVNAAVPKIVSDLVMRLLEKEPDRRYQSAEGLLQDLERIVDEPSATFALGQSDFGTRLKAPARLLGRDSQIESLRNAVARVGRGGSACVMVSGPAGSGKTALLAELRPLVAAAHGWAVFSASDASRRDAPGALFDGFQALGRQLLAEPAERLAQHKARILEALGANLGVALTQLPEFQMLLGEHPALDIADTAEAESRGIDAALALLRAVARPERPLVLVYDDVQWSPRGSGRILDAVVSAQQPIAGLMVVCAFNEAELDDAHALHGLLQRFGKLRSSPERLQLDGLNKSAATEFVGAVLRLPKDEASRLAAVIGERTLNNPGDTLAVLNSLRHDGLLQQSRGSWRWDAKALRRHVGGASAAELKRRLHAMPADTLSLLQTLACLGSDTAGHVLAWAADLPPAALASRVVAALDDGVLIGDGMEPPRLRLASDAVRQATLAALSAEAVRTLHLQIARRLAAKRDAHPELEARVAEQYLAAEARFTNEVEARDVARLFDHAAERVRSDKSPMAERYLAAAIAALGPFATPTDAGQMFHLKREHHRALFEQGRLDDTDAVYAELSATAPDPVELLEPVRIQSYGLMNRLRNKDGLMLSLDLLARLGLPKPDDVRPDIGEGVKRLTMWYRSEDKAHDFEKPEISDPRIVAWTKLIPESSNAAYAVDPSIWAWISLQGHKVWAEHGPSPRILSSLGGTSMVLLSIAQDYQGAYKVCRHALAVGEARGYEPATSFVRVVFGMSVAHWAEPIDTAVDTTMRRARRDLFAIGDESFVTNTYLAADLLLDCAPTLDVVANEIEEGMAFAGRSKNKEFSQRYTPRLQLVKSLRGQTSAPGSLNGDGFDEAEHERAIDPTGAIAAVYHVIRSIGAALFCQGPLLASHSAKAIALLPRMPGYYLSVAARVLRCVSLCDQARALPTGDEARAKLVEEFEGHLKWLTARAADAPENFLHLQRWLEAERAWMADSVWAAGLAFEAATAESKLHSRPWHRAMIHERAALFHLSEGMEQRALPLMLHACETYEAWGAAAKVKELRRAHPFLRAALQKRSADGSAPRSTVVDTEAVDMIAVLRASQALSSETSLSKLTTAVGKVLSAITGATGVRLVIKADDGSGAWVLADTLARDSGALTVDQAGAEAEIPLSVFRYAERLNQVLVVDDVTSDDRFAADPYAQRFAQCSLMMVPILKQGALNAMLMLENEQRRKAFSAERLDSVAMIAGQLSVSLDNALLYASLEKRVAERTAQLRQKTNDINAMLQNMPQGVLTVVSGGTIHPEYSAYLETILETKEIAGASLMDLIFTNTSLGADLLSQVDAAIASVIGEDEMNYEFNSHLLVSEFDKTLANGSVKSLALSWSPIANDEGTVDKLMLCVRDVTELKRLEAEANARKRELQVIGEILAVSQEKFHEFIDSARGFLAENKALIEKTARKDLDAINLLFRNMHTIKGNARTYGFLGLTNQVHTTEQHYDDLRKDAEAAWEQPVLLAELAQVSELIEQYAHVNDTVLGRKGPGRRAAVEKFLMVERELVQQVLQQLMGADRTSLTSVTGALDAVGARLHMLGTQPLGEVLSGTLESLPSLARELGKEVPEVSIEDHGIAVRTQASALLKNLFTHLLRNSVDHGLEPAAERVAAGKPAAGHIRMRLGVDDGKLHIHLRDDGRGLAIGKIRQQAMAQNLLTRGSKSSAEEIAQLIFRSGFSTAEKVTEVSGRGVGMDAVRAFLEKEGGEIAIRFLDDKERADYRVFETVISLPDKFAASAHAAMSFDALRIRWQAAKNSTPG